MMASTDACGARGRGRRRVQPGVTLASPLRPKVEEFPIAMVAKKALDEDENPSSFAPHFTASKIIRQWVDKKV